MKVKKLILGLIIVLLINYSPLYAEQSILKESNLNESASSTIQPELLTNKESKNYNDVNETSRKAFSNYKTHIDTSIYTSMYDNSPLIQPESNENPKYNFAKYNDAEMHYDKFTGKLEQISLNHSTNYPKIKYVYSFPSGNLKYVFIRGLEDELYFFSPDGKYFNSTSFIDQINNEIKSNWNPPLKKSSLSTKIVFSVDKTGKILEYKITQSSKNEEFDEAAVKALLSSEPLPRYTDCPLDYLRIEYSFNMNSNNNSNKHDKSIIEINKKIESNWEKPIFILKNLSVTVRFKIGKDGNILDYKIVSSSGNANFDNSLINAILISQPFSFSPKNKEEIEVYSVYQVKSIFGTIRSIF
jgi:TonB family protein